MFLKNLTFRYADWLAVLKFIRAKSPSYSVPLLTSRRRMSSATDGWPGWAETRLTARPILSLPGQSRGGGYKG